MRTHFAVVAGLLALLYCASGPRFLAAEEPVPIEPQPGVLVLNNGQTLAGKITRAGDRYYVALESGAINLPVGDVVLHCKDLQEAYRRQREANPGRVQNHLKLALWCLQNKLREEAQQELDDAAAIDPDDPKIGVLRRRLEQSTPTPASPSTAPAPSAPLRIDDLDRLVRGMPVGAVESFANDVQPLLLNHCAAAACHGAQAKNEFRLLRTSPGSAPSRRLTQRNLQHVLEHIDRDDPSKSELIKAIREPHGPANTPIFGSREAAKYQLLVDWVKLVAYRSPSEQSLSNVPDPAALLQRVPPDTNAAKEEPAGESATDEELRARWSTLEGDQDFRVTEDGTILMSADAGEPVDDKADRLPPSKKPPIRGAAGMAGRKSKVQWGAVPRVTPNDPFDPELFNRQFHPPR